mmetsp:Transcript_8542/g.22888  ORF Transcript_8542/g.22888 Transcript_8542/m.22888 type:complete len:96 (-) Transcript_8542:13-300(-)
MPNQSARPNPWQQLSLVPPPTRVYCSEATMVCVHLWMCQHSASMHCRCTTPGNPGILLEKGIISWYWLCTIKFSLTHVHGHQNYNIFISCSQCTI